MSKSFSAPSIQVLMPMGGRGARFKRQGIERPKPLLDIDGEPMFARSYSSVAALAVKAPPIVVLRQEDDERFQMAEAIERSIPGTRIRRLLHETRGPVESCLMAQDLLSRNDPLLILDCDVYFESRAYLETARKAMLPDSQIDGVLLYHRSTDPRFGFIELGADGLVSRTAEKKAISDKAIVGAYFFSKAEIFLAAARRLIVSSTAPLGEYYISQVYNALIEQDQARIAAAPVDRYLSFGTPEELAASLPLFRALRGSAERY